MDILKRRYFFIIIDVREKSVLFGDISGKFGEVALNF